MKSIDPIPARDREHPEPEELTRPIPKAVIVLVAMLLAWAVIYIVRQSPGLESSSAQGATTSASRTRA